MRTLIFAVIAVCMLTAPVWATVTISVVKGTGDLVDINYLVEGEAEPVRAFALDVTVSGAAVITAVSNYDTGDDNGGYGIFPANFSRYITVAQDGTVAGDQWTNADYTPVADGGDPGALGGLGTNGVTLELGALYEDNGPGNSGTLCSLAVSECCDMGLALNAMRGNVVLESAAEPGDIVLEGATDVGECDVDCFPNTPAYTFQYNDWVSLGKPDCWCHSSTLGPGTTDPEEGMGGAMNYEGGDYQCLGDAATDKENPLYLWRVSISDLNALGTAPWMANKDGTFGNPKLTNPCADVDHDWENPIMKWRVSIADLNVLGANWLNPGQDATILDPLKPKRPNDCPRPDAQSLEGTGKPRTRQ